ncbi:hypothetical protein SLEP1_g36924 [Rubroshorea leprosula]|uniref:Uncharacterized protein n=1 Tax=Rubroshorea leprosula TaxID=152421 RepID=A0AAV5KT86_9ROSI|nr:hypothetical protein SLEP1_g36924 [Rubroshorea leprosula]
MHAYLKVIVNCLDDLKVIVNCDLPVNFCLFCLRYGHVIRVPASGRFINASTCRHVSERAGSFNPASGGYTPANRVPASGRFINAGRDL